MTAKSIMGLSGVMNAQRRQRRGKPGRNKRLPPGRLVADIITNRLITQILKEEERT